MRVKMLTEGSKFWILILTITGMIFLGYSAVLAEQASCPCFTASIIDGAFAAEGPGSIEVTDVYDIYPNCDDYPNWAVAWIDSGTVLFKVTEDGDGSNQRCYWVDGPNAKVVENLSQAQAFSCRNEIVKSDVWSLIPCPRGDTN